MPRREEIFKILNFCLCVYPAAQDRTAMQILPRREGDLEMLEGGMFKSWTRYKFVLKDHCLEYHRYLPTGLHEYVI